MTAVAVLGTGTMGGPMARNLVKAGHDVTVWNRTRDRALPLAVEGATVAADPAAAVRGAEVVLTMLTDGPAVHEAMSAAVPGLRAGQVWVQMSTVGVDAFDRLAAFAHTHGLLLVDAPVQGTRQPAEAGTLVVLAAGPRDERAEEVFSAVGSKTVRVGEAGAATRLKLATVGFGIVFTSAVAEALGLAEGLGVSSSLFREVVTGGPLDSPYLQAKLAAITDGDYAPSFTVRNADKDTRLIAEAAARAGVEADLTHAAGVRFRRAEQQGYGDLDMAASYFASFPAPR